MASAIVRGAQLPAIGSIERDLSTKVGNPLAAPAMTRHAGSMLKTRAPFFVSVLLCFLSALLVAALKAIFDVTIQDFRKDTATPFLRERVGPWSATMLEWIGPYWSGVGSAILLMFVGRMVFARHRKRRVQRMPHPILEAAVTEPVTASRALRRLRFSGRLEAPEKIAKENIQSWFADWSPGGRAEDQNGNAPFRGAVVLGGVSDL